MKSTKRIAVIVGLLFLVSTLTFMIGSNQIRSFLIDVSQNKSPLFLGVILEIICGVAVVGIGVLMFPILKLFKKRLALGYVIFRIIECTIIIVGGIYLLSLLEFMWKYEMIFLFSLPWEDLYFLIYYICQNLFRDICLDLE
jgi:hypothetical protein